MIVDATFLKRSERDAFRVLAKDLGLAFEIQAPQASADQLRQRIQARSGMGQDASEATLEVLDRQMGTIEALGTDEL